jgi:CheY-like chemotaxis protein
MTPPAAEQAPLHVFCLEDNPLIVFHLEQIIEDLGHIFAGAAESFADLKAGWPALQMDCALVDIDLADGRTGPEAAAWLSMRNVRVVFVTAQDKVAAEHAGMAVAIVSKPVTSRSIASALDAVRRP